MDVLVPFDPDKPKSRLSSLFDIDERRAFASVMLQHVLETVDDAGCDPTILATNDLDVDYPVIVDEQSLTPAVNGAIADAESPIAVIVADLPLLTKASVATLLESKAPVVLAPGLGGGTNAIVIRDASFQVDYHGASFRDHREYAREIGIETAAIDSFRLAVDVDEPADLAEVLLHGKGRPVEWLRRAGVRVVVADGRVEIERS